MANKDDAASCIQQMSPCRDDGKEIDTESVWLVGSKIEMEENMKPIFKNLKEEVLNNKFAAISKRSWNETLIKCQTIYKGKSQSVRINEWGQQLKQNKIGMKELMALKLYCDYDELQREFSKCFRCPYNQNKYRLSSFYWWNKTLSKTFKKFIKLKCTKTYNVLFHGISSIMNINDVNGTYFGPLSTTTDISIARSFAGKAGMILVIKPNYNLNENHYKPLDISYLSNFPDESEVLCFNQSYCIKDIVLSSEFDTKHHTKIGQIADNMKNTKNVHKLSILESTQTFIDDVYAVV